MVMLFLPSFGQAKKELREIELKGLVYKNEFSFGARIHTNGYSGFGEITKFQRVDLKRVFQIEYMYFRSFQQKKQPVLFSPSNFGSKKDYFYGKQNNFWALRFNYGYRKEIASKAERSGVTLSMVYMGGFSLGFLKPYYLNLAIPDAQPTDRPYSQPERYTEENADRFLDKSKIDGASGIRYGWGEIEPVPGIHGRFGLNFDWASQDEFVKALEVGASIDLYYKRIPIMVTDDASRYFLGLYLSLQFGKRW
jgi:hypothetical protein